MRVSRVSRTRAVTRTPLPVDPADVVHARFLLTHLAAPVEALRTWAGALAAGGRLVLHEVAALDSADPVLHRYYGLVADLQRHHGQALDIGDRLAALGKASAHAQAHRREHRQVAHRRGLLVVLGLGCLLRVDLEREAGRFAGTQDDVAAARRIDASDRRPAREERSRLRVAQALVGPVLARLAAQHLQHLRTERRQRLLALVQAHRRRQQRQHHHLDQRPSQQEPRAQ